MQKIDSSNSNEINHELHQIFIESLKKEASLASGTLANLSRDIMNFILYLDENKAEICSQSVSSYISVLEEKYNEASFISKLSNLRRFVNWINLDQNPFWKIKASLNKEHLFYYKKDFFHQFYEKLDLDSIIILSLYETCSQISELADVQIKDYNFAGGNIHIRSLNIKLSEVLGQAIKNYIRSKDDIQLSQLLFVNKTEINKVLKNYDLKNTFIKRSRIIHLLQEGSEIEMIEKSLSLKLSNFYNDFVQEKDYRLLKAYNQFHPRASFS